MISAAVVGSLIVLNLFLFAQSHNKVWLLLDAVFAGTLAFRAWVTFGSDRKENEEIEWEMVRMRQMASSQEIPPSSLNGWRPSGAPEAPNASAPAPEWLAPTAPRAPVPPPPVGGGTNSQAGQHAVPRPLKEQPAPPGVEPEPPRESTTPVDPWSGSWSF